MILSGRGADIMFLKISMRLHFILINTFITPFRNKKKVFSNLDIDLKDTLKLAETKSLFRAETHISLTHGLYHTKLSLEATVLTIPG